MFTDFVMNRQGFGEVGRALAESRFEPSLLRPYFDKNGHNCADVRTGEMKTITVNGEDIEVPVYKKFLINDLIANGIHSPVFNSTSLRKNEWELFDKALVKMSRKRLRAWGDLAAANTYGGFNGMAKTLLEHETQNDPGEALVDMDALSEGRTDSSKYQLQATPLPITHANFWISERVLAVSRNTGTPLDTTMMEAATRRVTEAIEKTLIGVRAGMQYGAAANYGRTPKVYGYTNFPARLTYTTITRPTVGGWTAPTTVAQVLAMRDQLYAANKYGPFMLYHSADWDQYLDNDYSTSGGNNPSQTLRQRLRAIDDISDVRRLDFFSDTFSLVMVSMDGETARAVNGMDLTTIQWDSMGGLRKNFKVMCIMVPELKADQNGNCGILHGTPA